MKWRHHVDRRGRASRREMGAHEGATSADARAKDDARSTRTTRRQTATTTKKTHRSEQEESLSVTVRSAAGSRV
ncbi:hypothetical protein MRX96_012511 [Rhipicephalus microplus]